MSRKTNLTLSDDQHDFLLTESFRSGLSMAELVRRAIDRTYRPGARPRIKSYEFNVGLVRRPNAAMIGRHIGRRPLDE
jgi:hypothetical protein